MLVDDLIKDYKAGQFNIQDYPWLRALKSCQAYQISLEGSDAKLVKVMSIEPPNLGRFDGSSSQLGQDLDSIISHV